MAHAWSHVTRTLRDNNNNNNNNNNINSIAAETVLDWNNYSDWLTDWLFVLLLNYVDSSLGLVIADEQIDKNIDQQIYDTRTSWICRINVSCHININIIIISSSSISIARLFFRVVKTRKCGTVADHWRYNIQFSL